MDKRTLSIAPLRTAENNLTLRSGLCINLHGQLVSTPILFEDGPIAGYLLAVGEHKFLLYTSGMPGHIWVYELAAARCSLHCAAAWLLTKKAPLRGWLQPASAVHHDSSLETDSKAMKPLGTRIVPGYSKPVLSGVRKDD